MTTQGWSVRRAVLPVALAAALLATVGALVGVRPGDPFSSGGNGTDGPLQPPASVTLSGQNLAVGAAATWGHLVVNNTTSRPVTLRSVHLGGGIAGTHSAVRIDRIQAVDPATTGGSGIGMVAGDGLSAVGAPLRSPVEGYTVAPSHDAALLVRFTATRAGAWRYDHADITYTVDGAIHHLRLRQGLGVCAPAREHCNVGIPPGP